MRKYQKKLVALTASVILFSSFKNDNGDVSFSSQRSPQLNSHSNLVSDPVKINISDAIVIQGNKGQKTVEVMILLSKPSTEPVTVQYNTKDKTAKAGVDYIATNGSIKFEPGEVSKMIKVAIIGEVAADPDVDATIDSGIEFWVNLNGAIGALIEKADAIITIIKNLVTNSNINKVESVYEVAIVFQGFLSTYGPINQCGAKTNGIIVLSGLLKGDEYLDPKDPGDVLYRGTLQMIIAIDECSATNYPNDDQPKHCVLHVSGSGTVEAELEITYGTDKTGKITEGRGGYLKMENRAGGFLKTVVSDCDPEQSDDVKKNVPNDFFNYMSLPMIKTRTLQQGLLPTETDEAGNKTTVNVVRKIR